MLVKQSDVSAAEPVRLRGRLGLWSIVFIVVAGAAPLTVVGGPVPLAFAIGNGAGVPAMFLITGVLLVLFAIGFTTMAQFVRATGAFYAYAHEGLGRRVGIGTGYVALLSYLSLYIGMFGLLGPAVGTWVESYGGPALPWWIWSMIALVGVGVVGCRSIEFSGAILGVLLVAEVVVVFVLDASIAVTGAHGEGLSSGFVNPSTVMAGAPGVAFLFAVLGFIGVEATMVFRDEAHDPDTTVPRATYISVVFIAAFYALTSWLMVSGIGESRIVEVASESPDAVLPNLMEQYVGKLGADIVMALFVTSILACILTFHNVVARYVFSLAARDLLPRRFDAVHPQFGSPSRASIAVSLAAGAATLGAVLVGLDAVGEFYTWLVGLASLGYVVLLVITTAAVIAYFTRHREIPIHPFRTRIAPALALVGLGVALVLILVNLTTLVGDNAAVAVAVVLLLVGAFLLGPVVGVLRPRAARPDPTPDRTSGPSAAA